MKLGWLVGYLGAKSLLASALKRRMPFSVKDMQIPFLKSLTIRFVEFFYLFFF